MDKKEIENKLTNSSGESARYEAIELAEKGNEIAKKEKYKHLKGREAVEYYLMQKHNWTPPVVKSLSANQLLFALSEV